MSRKNTKKFMQSRDVYVLGGEIVEAEDVVDEGAQLEEDGSPEFEMDEVDEDDDE